MVHSDPMVLSNDLDQIRSMEHNGALFALANWVGWTWRSSKWDVPKSVMRGWCGIPWCTACSSTHVFIVLHYARWSCLFCSPFDYPIESVSWDGDVYQVSESKIAHRLEGDDTTLNWFLHLHFLMTQVVISVRKQTFERKQRRITAWISTSDAMMYWFYGCLWILWLLVGRFWPQLFAHRITSLPETKSVKAVDSDFSVQAVRFGSALPKKLWIRSLSWLDLHGMSEGCTGNVGYNTWESMIGRSATCRVHSQKTIASLGILFNDPKVECFTPHPTQTAMTHGI